MKKRTLDRQMLSVIFALAWPTMLEELMQTGETTQKPLWMYLIPGAGAAALLAILGVARLSLSGKGKKKKGEESER